MMSVGPKAVDAKGVDNLVQMIFESARRRGDAPFLWEKRDGAYAAQTWTEVVEHIILLAKGLLELGIEPGDRVVLVSENRPDWLICECAIMAVGAIMVPSYTTNTVDDHHHILVDSGAKGVFASTPKLAAQVLAAMDRRTAVEFAVVFEQPAEVYESPLRVLSLQAAYDLGRARTDDIETMALSWRRDRTACIIYTSGTVGRAKGVMLAHGAILHNCHAAQDVLAELGLDDEVFLSFLPLSHAYEHSAGLFFPVSIGAQIYYPESLETLAGNMQEARPTIMTAVPRLFETLHKRITGAVELKGGLQKVLFDKTSALGRKKFEGRRLSPIEWVLDRILDKLVRDKVRARFGGRLKIFVSGGAPLNPEIGLFFISLGVPVIQAYGLTESAPGACANRPHAVNLETVGPPVADTELKIAEDGEILLKGELVMQGYWNNEEQSRITVRDGWLHTGDIGYVDEDGNLVIKERKKHIIVNSGGDNIAPQRVENAICFEPEFMQAMVIGDKRPHIVGLVVPDEDWLTGWKKVHGKSGDLATLHQDPDLVKAMEMAMRRINADLSQIERVRKFIIAEEALSIENGMITPSLKTRRHKVLERYGERLNALY